MTASTDAGASAGTRPDAAGAYRDDELDAVLAQLERRNARRRKELQSLSRGAGYRLRSFAHAVLAGLRWR